MTATVAGEVTLDDLLERLWRNRGWDFREYRRGTLERRTARRLLATGARTYRDYMRILDGNPGEYDRLHDCLTVTVSGFFRNPCTFERFAGAVVPALVGHRTAIRQKQVRVWSAACACGEEPYSIAMALRECLGDYPPGVSVYATDISRPALERAAAGLYPAERVAGLPPAVLADWFLREGDGYRVKADIRQMVQFSCFDLAAGGPPPFTGLDAVFCCNVLIYLQRRLQARVLDMLCRSLATPGYLVLGEAETPPGELRDRLECLDSKARIYCKKE